MAITNPLPDPLPDPSEDPADGHSHPGRIFGALPGEIEQPDGDTGAAETGPAEKTAAAGTPEPAETDWMRGRHPGWCDYDHPAAAPTAEPAGDAYRTLLELSRHGHGQIMLAVHRKSGQVTPYMGRVGGTWVQAADMHGGRAMPRPPLANAIRAANRDWTNKLTAVWAALAAGDNPDKGTRDLQSKILAATNQMRALRRHNQIVDTTNQIVMSYWHCGPEGTDPTLDLVYTAPVEHLDPLRYLGAPNGAVDLSTGALIPPEQTAGLLLTRTLPDPYDPTAEHPDVDALTAHLPDAVEDYVWKSLGYALWGKPGRVMLAIIGPPAGGKSTFAEAVRTALGSDYAVAVGDGALSPNKDGAAPSPELGKLMGGARLGFAPELESQRTQAARLKKLTGGDAMAHRDLYGPVRNSVATATLVMVGNDMPAAGFGAAGDPAFAERLRVVPVGAVSASARRPNMVGLFEDDDDPEARYRRQAIVARLVAGCAKTEPGAPPAPPPEVVTETQDRLQQDIGDLGAWLQTAVERAAEGRLLTRHLFQAAEAAGVAGGPRGATPATVTKMARNLHSLPAAKKGQRAPKLNGPGSDQGAGWPGWRLAADARPSAPATAAQERMAPPAEPDPAPGPGPVQESLAGPSEPF